MKVMNTAGMIDSTHFAFPGQTALYHGKVRDVYDLGESLLFVASDRYSLIAS
jgi:phosphoribosylaminoimidazole-succinocarboxamide synthase